MSRTTKDLYLKKDELKIHLHITRGEHRVIGKWECGQSMSAFILDPLTPQIRWQVVSDTFKIILGGSDQ